MIHRQDGFTLIDVMIGSVLSGLLLAALVGIFQTGYQSLRVSSDAYLGQDDVQLTLRYLMPDVQGTTRAHIAVPTNVPVPGRTLTLGVPDPVQDRFVSVTYVYDDTAGTLTRSATWSGLVSPEQVVVARHLKPGTRFTYCATGDCEPVMPGTGPKLRATLVFEINGTPVIRVLDLAPKPTL